VGGSTIVEYASAVAPVLVIANRPTRTTAERATLGWVHWVSRERLHEHLDYDPRAEFQAVYAAEKADRELVRVA
jgi:hypothetical protein